MEDFGGDGEGRRNVILGEEYSSVVPVFVGWETYHMMWCFLIFFNSLYHMMWCFLIFFNSLSLVRDACRTDKLQCTNMCNVSGLRAD
jgi:hypothetical protein